MGSLLGNIIEQRQGKDIFDKVEKLRHLAKVSRLLKCVSVRSTMLGVVFSCC